MFTKTWIFALAGGLVLLLAGCAGSQTRGVDPGEVLLTTPTSVQADEDRSGCVVSSVPNELGFDPFYKKYCDADGIPIISSGEVDDLALQQAHYLITSMLAPIPDVRQELISNRAYFGIIGENEMQTTLPEYSHMDSQYWDCRARGLGASRGSPITSAAEENLLCLPGDRYRGESIAVHEFAHTIALLGFGEKRDVLEDELSGLYETALQKGLWINTYAASDIQEYWAEGVQSYFDTNLEAEPPNGVHNHVDTREELAEYDLQLHEFISRVFNGYRWTADCPPQG